jgi:hypothetical protein
LARNEFICWVEDAKQEMTRERRIRRTQEEPAGRQTSTQLLARVQSSRTHRHLTVAWVTLSPGCGAGRIAELLPVMALRLVVDARLAPNRRWRMPASGSRTSLDIRIRCSTMAAWKVIEQAEPEFAGRVQRLFDAGRHKTIATLRADGSPRISGIECEFADGDLRFGSMTGARKGADLKRDPRFALHGPAFHPQMGKENDWPGEAKIAGRAILAGPVTNEASQQPDGDMFTADITEVVITGLNPEATKLVLESWTPERGLWRVERD